MAPFVTHFCPRRQQHVQLHQDQICPSCGAPARDDYGGMDSYRSLPRVSNGEGLYHDLSSSPYAASLTSPVEPHYPSSTHASGGWPVTSAAMANGMYLPTGFDPSQDVLYSSPYNLGYEASPSYQSAGDAFPPQPQSSYESAQNLQAASTATASQEHFRVACPYTDCPSGSFARTSECERHIQNDHREQILESRTVSRPRVLCPYEGCDHATFSRPADVERHIQTVHKKSEIPLMDCPYPKCHRRGSRGFARKDHWLEHRRCYHHEAIPKGRKGTSGS